MILLLLNDIKYLKSDDLTKKVKDEGFTAEQVAENVKGLNKQAYEQHTSNPDVTIEVSKSTLELSRIYGYKKGQGNALFNIGVAHFAKGEFHSAIDFLIKALHVFSGINYLKGEAKAVHSIANTYVGLGSYQIALKYLFRSLEISQNLADDKAQIAKTYGSIGTTFSKLDNFTEALRFHEMALALRTELKDSKYIAYCMVNIGAIHQNLGNLDFSKSYYEEAIGMSDKLENQEHLMGTVHVNLGQLFMEEADYKKALDHLFKALNIRLGVDSMKGTANCNICIGKVYLQKGEFDKAIEYIEQATIMYEAIDAKGDLVDCYESLSYCYEGVGNNKLALENARKTSSMNSKLFSEERAKTVAELQTTHNFKAKEKEIARLNKEQHFLKTRNEELKKFASIVSHDLREPMRTIISFTQQIERKYNDKLDDVGQEFMHYIVDASGRMIKMLGDLKNYALSGVDEGNYDDCDLNEIMQIVHDNLQVHLKERSVKLDIQEGFPTVHGSRTKLIQLFQNLVANGIKFQKPDVNPHIKVGFEQSATHSTFFVADNGIGMEKDNTKHIFEMFKRLHNRNEYEGTGTGLAICKQIIEQLGGKIWVESEIGEGSTFYMEVPMTAIVDEEEK